MTETSLAAWEARNFDHGPRPVAGSAEEAALVDQVFAFYRQRGFPFVQVDEVDVGTEITRLQRGPSMLVGKQIRQSMWGLRLVNAYHPEMVKVKCRDFRTPWEVFHDDRLFRAAICKRIRYGSHLKVWGIRKALYSYSRTQRVSNFRPTAAQAVYRHFAPRLTVDPCAGWGSRLLGAWVTGIPYVGIDPQQETQRNNQRLVADLARYTGNGPAVELVVACAEDVLGTGRWTPDLVFTSPPYLDVERYSDEPTQSYRRYQTPAAWYAGFLAPVIRGAFHDLPPGGHLVLNVNPDMRQVTEELAVAAGFCHRDTWVLQLSRHQYNKASCGLYRDEPILVFQKEL